MSVLLKFFFGRILSKAMLARADTVAGVRDATVLQKFLKLAIFTKGSVQII